MINILFFTVSYAVFDLDGNVIHLSDPAFLEKKLHPGSIMKIVIAYALFKMENFSPVERVYSSEWKRSVNLEEAIALSSKDYFYKWIDEIPQSTLRKAGVELGLFMDTTGYSVDLEKNPLISIRRILFMMMKLAKREGLSPEPLGYILRGMRYSVLYGTSKNKFLYNIGVAGKTGTSQYTDHWRTYGLFAGFLPFNEPRIVFVFYVDRGVGRDAVKECEKFMKRWYSHYFH